MENIKTRGITLIALIITIILMLILAGVVLNLTIGESGLFGTAKYAVKKWNNSVEQENTELDELYGSILVAGDSKVTLTMEQLDEYINKKIQQPTEFKSNTYICNSLEDSSDSGSSSMEGLVLSTDENNKISEYLSYSNKDGYTVKKSGWYFISMQVWNGSKQSSSYGCTFFINSRDVSAANAWASGGFCNIGDNAFSIFLKQGDKIHFETNGTDSLSLGRIVTAYCYPMF